MSISAMSIDITIRIANAFVVMGDTPNNGRTPINELIAMLLTISLTVIP